MKTISVSEAKARLSAYIRDTEEGPVILTRNGKAVAVLMNIEELDDWDDRLLESPQFQAILEKARREIDEGKGMPAEEFWKQVEAES